MWKTSQVYGKRYSYQMELLFNFLSIKQNTVSGANLKGNSGIFKPGPYFWHEIRSSTHREQFAESRRPSEDI